MKGKTHPRLREFYRSMGDDNSIPFDHLTLGGRLAVRMTNKNIWDMMKENTIERLIFITKENTERVQSGERPVKTRRLNT